MTYKSNDSNTCNYSLCLIFLSVQLMLVIIYAKKYEVLTSGLLNDLEVLVHLALTHFFLLACVVVYASIEHIQHLIFGSMRVLLVQNLKAREQFYTQKLYFMFSYGFFAL